MNRCTGHTIFATHVRSTNGGIDYAIAIECQDCGARAVGHFIDPKRAVLAGARVRPITVSIAPRRPLDVPPSKPWVPPEPPKPSSPAPTVKVVRVGSDVDFSAAEAMLKETIRRMAQGHTVHWTQDVDARDRLRRGLWPGDVA